MKIIKTLFVVFVAIIGVTALSGCASILHGTTKTINVQTSNGQQTEVAVTSASGTQRITAPSAIVVKKSSNPIIINVKESERNEASSAVMQSHVDYVFLLGFFTGGLIGTTTDAATGALWTYDDIVLVPVVTKH